MVRAHIQCNSMTSLWSMANVFHIRLSLFLKQLDMNEEDILRITAELLLRRSFILETVLSFIYPGTILLICLCSSYPGQSGSHAQIPYLQQCKVKSRNQGT